MTSAATRAVVSQVTARWNELHPNATRELPPAAGTQLQADTRKAGALPAVWTPIAERERGSGFTVPPWISTPGAIMTVETAHELVEAKLLLMASRVFPDRVVLVIKRALPPDDARPDPAPLRPSAFRFV